MTKLLPILFLVYCTVGYSQEEYEYWQNIDTVVLETELVHEINTDSIRSLMIFSYINNHGHAEAKGFLVENNIPGGSINNTLSIPNCNDSCDVRMEAKPISDSLFIIKYKWRMSQEFIVDTFYIFRHYGKYMTYSKNIYFDGVLRQTINRWYLGPSSTDERDVIQICNREARKTVFYFLQ